MESVNYFRGIQRYLKSKTSRLETADYEGILKMELMNPKPSTIFSNKPYVFEDFNDWFMKGGREKLQESQKTDKDDGFKAFKNLYWARLQEILGLSEKGAKHFFGKEDVDNFKKSMVVSLAEDSYRGMFFFLFSFFIHSIESSSVYWALWNMKPDKGDYPSAFHSYVQKMEEEGFDFEKTGLGNILHYLKENYHDAYQVWLKLVLDDNYLFVVKNPYFYNDFCQNTVKVFNLGPMGMDLKSEESKNFFFNALIGLISGHRLVVLNPKMKEMRMLIEKGEDKSLFSIYENKKLVIQKENIRDFMDFEYKGFTVCHLLKKAQEIKILA